MKKPFKNPIAEHKKTRDGQKEWSFKAPSYDMRTSDSVSAGDDYGVGFKTPTGKDRPSSMQSGPIPQKSRCFTVAEALHEDIER